jgi:RNA 2',3'-cyclic 3'-phosphodiesterase
MTVIPADPTAPMRLFVALWPDPVTRAAIAQWQQAWDLPPRAAPVKPDRLHLTLHFLGNVPAGRMGEITAGLRSPFEPFELDFGHGGVWPNGIAALEPIETPPQLERLHARLRDAVLALGLAADARPFRPHITLSRRARGARPPEQQARFLWQVDQGYVLACAPGGGAGYEIVRRFEN